MIGMTPQMAACVAAIRKLTADGVPPSYDAIRVEMGLRSKSNVHRLLTCLKERGIVDWRDGQAHSLSLVEDAFSTERLERLGTYELLNVAARIAGIVAHRNDDAKAAKAFRNVADAIEHRPRSA